MRTIYRLLSTAIVAFHTSAFVTKIPIKHAFRGSKSIHFSGRKESDSFSTSSKSSKNIVSSLTNLVNFILLPFENSGSRSTTSSASYKKPPPSSPSELLRNIEEDYTVKNYLWTGDIHLPAFENDCRFTDPTLSFIGLDRFVSNVKNLRIFTDLLVEECRSELLDITLNEEEGYVQSRWNMVGDLTGLPWKPRIDVVGNTKFWYKNVEDKQGIEGVRVFFYDEKWEMPAGKALLQLVTPAGKQSL